VWLGHCQLPTAFAPAELEEVWFDGNIRYGFDESMMSVAELSMRGWVLRFDLCQL
jgi:hypothetical protein